MSADTPPKGQNPAATPCPSASETGWLAPIRPLPFLGAGVVLFAIKIGIDLLVSQLFGEPYSVTYYVSPVDAPLLRPGDHLQYWLAMWGVALPFIAAGLWLTVRRLRDAGLPAWMAGLFFMPFANLVFFAVCAVLPSRPGVDAVADTAGRFDAANNRSMSVAVLSGGGGGAAITLGTMALSVGLFGDYGAALFLGSPVLAGFFGTLLYSRLRAANVQGMLAVTTVSLAISFVVLLGFAFEGLICLVMAAPLAFAAALVGGVIALGVARALPAAGTAMAPAMVPLLVLVEVLAPLPVMEDSPVTTTVIVDAPPEVVWRHVIAFPDLDPPDHWLFAAGVAAPVGATIEGAGVGAVRRCRFTTGTFVEPVTVWEPGRELGFSVQAMPEPMKELSPWDIRPRHLDGYFVTTRGRFLLEDLGDGRTRLSGTTWYRLDLAPRPYWGLWTQKLIHEIHRQVLGQVKTRAEADQRDAG